ncbi:hypothetical protein F511_14169 [Dorcoceras hygrometricum]|uniref:Uncharacterized protein n=1 Tax=Dorcoceras hygrometricum TaxID=472368 RepID=A0A2Z7CVZ5_9LAMI|nr:hypothetical protein F511_14169 [Dorcoceras hygrometricum]
MASSLYSNAQHVDFDSVLGMDDPGMVSMFEALMASGLRGFLGCPAVVYEDALIDFFENASVRNGVVFSTVGGSSAVDIQVIELLSDLYLYFLEELAKEARNLGLTWTKPCCSQIFEGRPRDRGAVIARSNSNTRSLCWIRRMFLVDGVWTVELCADRWVKIPKRIISAEVPLQRQYDDTLPTMSVFFKLLRKRWADVGLAAVEVCVQRLLWAVEMCADRWVKIPKRIVSTEVPLQRQYDDTLPTMSVFFKLLRKRWADVCLEAVEFCVQRLLPVGSIRSCRSLQLSGSGSSFAPTQPTVFAVRVSQFCSVFVDMSLFSWLPTTDISEFLSAIALEKTVLRGVQCFEDSFSVAPRVQLALEQQQSSSSSSSSSPRFDHIDVDATASSRLPISQDLSVLFADFQATLSEQLFESQSNISSKLHKIEQNISWNDVVEVHSFVSADEDFSRLFVEVVQQLLSLFVEDCYTTAFDLVGTTAFGLIQQKRFFVNQQMLFLVFTSRCISKIAKRRHLIKLTRHRFIAKGISR